MAFSQPTRTSAESGAARNDDIRASQPTASRTVVFPWALPPAKTVIPGPTSTSDYFVAPEVGEPEVGQLHSAPRHYETRTGISR